MENIIGNIINFLTKNVSYFVYAIVILFFITALIFIIKKIKEYKEYDVLVRIYPIHSKSKIYNQEKKKYEVAVIPYFTSGTFFFDANKGEYKVIIKDPKKIEIGAISFDYFVPINHKKFKYMLTLAKYSPVDYKPIYCRISYNELKEVQHLYDTEAIYVGLKTIEEVTERFSKKGKFEKYLPYIFSFIVIIVVFIVFLLILKEHGKIANSLKEVSNSLSKVAENLLLATK